MDLKKESNKILLVVFVHFITIIGAYCLLRHLGFNYVIPTNDNIVRFDAYWYYSIVNEGYTYVPGVGNNMAFFPLFPIIWYYSDLTPLAISGINYIVFIVGFIYLFKGEKMPVSLLLMFISFPSFIFFALPYSESFFFLFCSFIVVGLRKKNEKILYIGLFCSSLVRSVCMIFVPALILCEIFNFKDIVSRKEKVIKLTYRLLASLSGFFVASAYMGIKSGKWFYFIEIQKYWLRSWGMIKLPFTTFSPERILGIDAITLMLGILAIYLSIKWSIHFYGTLRKKISETCFPDQSILFSAFFIAGMTILDAFFTRYVYNSSSLWSINRHIMCTPFAMVFIIYLYNQYEPKRNEKLGLCVLFISSVFFTGIFKYLNLNVFIFFILFFITLFTLKYKKTFNKYFFLYYVIAVFLQISLYRDFISNLWVG